MFFVSPLEIIYALFPFQFVVDKFTVYSAHGDGFEPLNVFGILPLVKILSGLFFIYHRGSMSQANPLFYLFLKMYLLGLIFYVGLGHFPQIGVRFSQLFFISEIILISMCSSLVRPRFVGVILVVIYAAVYFYLNLNFTSYFRYVHE